MKKLFYTLFFVVFTATTYAASIGPAFEKPDVTASVLVASGVHFGRWAKKQNSSSNQPNQLVTLNFRIYEGAGKKGPGKWGPGKMVTIVRNLTHLDNQMIINSFHDINFGEDFKYYSYGKSSALPSNVRFKFSIDSLETGKELYSCNQKLYMQSIHANAHFNVALQIDSISNPQRCNLITEAVE